VKSREELKREYRATPPPMGVFLVRNRSTGRFLVQATPNLKGRMNRLQFDLERASHPSAAFPADWKASGPEAFEIRVLDVLEPKDTPGWSPASDLEALEALWRARLTEEGGTPY